MLAADARLDELERRVTGRLHTRLTSEVARAIEERVEAVERSTAKIMDRYTAQIQDDVSASLQQRTATSSVPWWLYALLLAGAAGILVALWDTRRAVSKQHLP